MDSEPQQENKKYRVLLDTARGLFFKHGIKRITVEEICEKANVSKVTFYKHFHNKDDLVMKILQNWVDEGVREFQTIRDENIPFMDKMLKLIRLKLATAQEYGHDFIDEVMGGTNENMKAFYRDITMKTMDFITDFFKGAQQEGQFRKTVPPEFYIYLIEHISEMMNDGRLKKILPDPHDRFQELMNILFFGFNECDKTIEYDKLTEG
jgi:AcrR family transcriptional regulator